MPYNAEEQYVFDPASGSVKNMGRHTAASTNTVTGSSNAAAVITKAAVAAKRHVLQGVTVSYSGGATAGSVKIEDVSGTTVFFADVNFATTGGQVHFPFTPPLKTAAVNTALIITAAAGGASTVAKVNLTGYWTE